MALGDHATTSKAAAAAHEALRILVSPRVVFVRSLPAQVAPGRRMLVLRCHNCDKKGAKAHIMCGIFSSFPSIFLSLA